MSVRLSDLRAGIVTALQAVNGSAPYTSDLSGSDQVKQGLYATPPRAGLPCVMLAEWSVNSEFGPQLGRWTRTTTWTIVGWAPANGDDPATRWAAVETLANDIEIALETATRVGALKAYAYDCIVREVNEVETGGEATGYATFAMTIDFPTRVNKLGGM